MPRFHPNEDLLMEAAMGDLCPMTHVLVQTHCELCDPCAGVLHGFELIRESMTGGFKKDIVGIDLGAGEKSIPQDDPVLAQMPAPILPLVVQALSNRVWRDYAPGLSGLDLDEVDYRNHTEVGLFRFMPGTTAPWHTHPGQEILIILSGSLTDHRGTYHRGDIVISDADITHAPKAGPDEICYCFGVAETPLIMVDAPEPEVLEAS